jgi:hypothetical protein
LVKEQRGNQLFTVTKQIRNKHGLPFEATVPRGSGYRQRSIFVEGAIREAAVGPLPHRVEEMKRIGPVALLLALAAAAPARCETAPPSPPRASPSPASPPKKPKSSFELFGSWRLRQEVWDWFGSGPEGRYTFTGSLLRLGAAYKSPHNDLMLEISQPTLLNLPQDASLAPPQGQLGLGGAYRDANGSQQASLFVKQAFWRYKGLGDPSNSVRLGRFEFIDGTEIAPKDGTLAWLKRERIAHRLIGNFGWSHVQRSFDGGEFVHNTPALNITAFGGMPTEGVFDLDGGATLTGVKIGYVSATKPLPGKKTQGEARAFALHYEDERDGVIKADNRPGPERAADKGPLKITTLGGHYLGVRDVGSGKIDGLLWGAAQFGEWGALDHGAYAFAAEAGYQPKHTLWNPWFRAGFYRGSGDDNPKDGRHGTFFPVLPTPRVYARFPFYNEANLDDAFVQAIAHPEKRLTLRGDVHFLSLADSHDLWYSGGGAFQGEPSFGYGGRPSHGSHYLATVLDLSADFQVRKNTTVSAYFGYALGGSVIRNIYPSNPNGFLGYLEFSQKF